MKKILMIVSAVMRLSVSAFAGVNERVSSLEATVATLTERVAALESAPQVSWSCSALCGGYGGGHLSARPVSGAGSTAQHSMHLISCEQNAIICYL